MSVRDRLNRLAGNADHSAAPAFETEAWAQQLQQELQVSVLQESGSFILLKESTFPLFHEPFFEHFRSHGFSTPHLRKITSDFPEELPDETINLRQALFIDTETTGLSGGTGTYPFLIGIGHIEADHLVVRQYLLPEFVHEWLMLKHLDIALQSFEFTVSFNGKSFDLPLLRSRYILNRMESILDERMHLDLLHAARRIWRRRLPACDLQTLEQHILGKTRDGDIPGELIPHIYFEFIRKRDAWMLRDVLEHNFHDIVNLMLLTMRISAICESPDAHLSHPLDQFSLAMYLMKKQRLEEAATLLDAVVSSSARLSRETGASAAFMLSLCHKKSGNSALAKATLESLVARQVLTPDIIETLAKFYEHEDKDFRSAAEIVERGIHYLSIVQQMTPQSPLLKSLNPLKHRLKRIHRKMGLK